MTSADNNINIAYFFLILYLSLTPLLTKQLEHPITLKILLKYHNLSTQLI